MRLGQRRLHRFQPVQGGFQRGDRLPAEGFIIRKQIKLPSQKLAPKRRKRSPLHIEQRMPRLLGEFHQRLIDHLFRELPILRVLIAGGEAGMLGVGFGQLGRYLNLLCGRQERVGQAIEAELLRHAEQPPLPELLEVASRLRIRPVRMDQSGQQSAGDSPSEQQDALKDLSLEAVGKL